LEPIRSTREFLTGTSRVLGEFELPWQAVFALQIGQGHLRPENPLSQWKLIEPPPPPSAVASGTANPLVGQPAPDFALRTLDGGLIRLSQLRGNIVVLDFWATWCQPCIAALPKIMEVTSTHREQNVELLAVNQSESVEIVRPFLEEKQWQLPVALDVDGDVSRLYGVDSIPRTMIIDAEGVVRAVHAGATPDLDVLLAEQLQALILGRPITPPIEPAINSPLLNEDISDNTLRLLDGQDVTLASYRGKVVVLDFWATWCGPCIRSLPELMGIAEQVGEDKLVLIAVNQLERQDVVGQFLSDRGWNLNVALDPKGTLAGKFGIDSIPRTLVLDKRGILRHVHAGATPELKATLEAEIEALLNAE
jgi:peroxiredoxin